MFIKKVSLSLISLGVTLSLLGISKPVEAAILFEDNFNDGQIDQSKWNLGSGSYVEEVNGMLRVVQAVTDNGGTAFSIPIEVNSTGKITLTLRTRTHKANDKYTGAIGLNQLDNNNNRNSIASISHIDYYWNGPTYAGDWEGFGDSNSMQSGGNAFFAPIWDEWVDEVLIYDPVTNTTTYSLNGANHITYETAYDLSQDSVEISLGSYGWWTGHYLEVDYIKLEQAEAGVPEPSLILGFIAGGAFLHGIRRKTRKAKS